MPVLEADVLPHDEEDGGGDEGELDGAGEEEGGAVLQHLPHQGTAAPGPGRLGQRLEGRETLLRILL